MGYTLRHNVHLRLLALLGSEIEQAEMGAAEVGTAFSFFNCLFSQLLLRFESPFAEVAFASSWQLQLNNLFLLIVFKRFV